jgi:sugar-specific transcriptional regulator TrmB
MQKSEKIMEKIEKKEHGSYSAALGAKAKAKPTPSKPTMFTMNDPAERGAWSEADVDEDRDKEVMQLDHIIQDLDETAGDFSDEDTSEKVAVTPTARNRFGLPVAQPKVSSLQLRFDQLEREREEAKEKAAKDNEELRAAQQENESAIAQLLTQFEGLQATILAHQEENNAKFAQLQTKNQAQFSQMLAFFQKLEKDQKQVHGKGSSKGVHAQKRDGAEEEADEDAHPKKLKVPFDSLSNAAASAASGC